MDQGAAAALRNSISLPAGAAPPSTMLRATSAALQQQPLPPPSPLSHAATAGAALLRGATPSGGSPTAAAAAGKHADMYLAELLSYSLERLRREPELLAEERAQLARALQTGALSHYAAFIDAAGALEAARGSLEGALGRLDALQAAAPKLSEACAAFSKDAAAALAERAANKQLLAQQPALAELLEAPALMDACARAGAYDEALDLGAFVSRAALLHGDLKAVRALRAQAAEARAAMREQLLARLKGSVQLPECLRVVGYLRRMGAFSEAELRLRFLACREHWFANLISELDADDPYEYAKALTDAHRLHVFDILMQYRAVFFDGGGGTGGSGPGGGGAGQAALDGGATGSALASWAAHRAAAYVGALRGALLNVTEGAHLASLMEHCAYCGASLARVGLDFRPLLTPVVEAATLQLFAGALAVATDAFSARLDAHKWVAMPAPMFKQQQQQQPASSQDGGSDASTQQQQQQQGGGGGSGGEDLSPPYALMEHPPLAVLANGCLSALNELRHCALAPLRAPMAAELTAALERGARALAAYRCARPLDGAELDLYRSAGRAYRSVLAPYLAACFARLFAGSGGGGGAAAAGGAVDVAAISAALADALDDDDAEGV